MHESGKCIIFLGLIITMMGIIWYFWGNVFSWVGRLPGDIRIERENVRFYFPLTTMILLSLIVQILIRLFYHFFK